MSALKPAYLIHGDDHGAVGERRLRLLAVAAADSAGGVVELLEGGRATPGGLADALAAPCLRTGRRVIVIDGVERWKAAEVKQRLGPALRDLDAATTVAMFACEHGVSRAPAELHRMVIAAGGQVAREATLTPARLASWVSAQARRLGLELDAEAARALVAQVGERRQRLLRELEKLALELGGGERPDGPRSIDTDYLERRAARSAQMQAFALADALVEGSPARAVRIYVGLRGQGERLPGLMYLMASRVRQALSVVARLERGESSAAVRRSLRMPAKAAEHLIANASRAGQERLQEALIVLADLELESRGGPLVDAGGAPAGTLSAPSGMRGGHAGALGAHAGALDEDTLAVRALEVVAGGLG